MSDIIRNDFSISGHLAFNAEQKYNYVTIEKVPLSEHSNIFRDINKSCFETIQRGQQHSDKNPPNIKLTPSLDKPFVKPRRARVVHKTAPCFDEPGVNDINYKTAQNYHEDIEKPFRFIKLRDAQNTPSRVKQKLL